MQVRGGEVEDWGLNLNDCPGVGLGPQSGALPYFLERKLHRWFAFHSYYLMDKRIDDIVVSHMLSQQDFAKYGDYLDVNQYETYRRALKQSFIRRKQRNKLTPESSFIDSAETTQLLRNYFGNPTD